MSGKGSSPRPFSVPLETFNTNFDAIFRKPDPREVDDALAEDEAWKELERRIPVLSTDKITKDI